MTLDQAQRIAMHESGHAIVASALGQEVSAVRMWLNIQAAKPDMVTPGGHAVIPWRRGSPPKDRIAVFAAGCAAESLKDQRVTVATIAVRQPMDGEPRLTDWELIQEALREVKPRPSRAERERIVDKQWNRALDILEKHSRECIILCNALLAMSADARREAQRLQREHPDQDAHVKMELVGSDLAPYLNFVPRK